MLDKTASKLNHNHFSGVDKHSYIMSEQYRTRSFVASFNSLKVSRVTK